MCLLGGLLLLCLACLELPEMSALHDDVSNDFTMLTAASSVAFVVTQVRVTMIRNEGRRITSAFAATFCPPIEFERGRTPQELLLLYCIWRT
jgi:hypothetical protein